MKGKIIDYNPQENRGLIVAQNGDRYHFDNDEWKSKSTPKINQIVNFELDNKRVCDINPQPSSVVDADDEDVSEIKFGADLVKPPKQRAKELESMMVEPLRELTKASLITGVINKAGFFTSFALLVMLAWHSANNLIFGTITIGFILFIMIFITLYMMLMFAVEHRERIIFSIGTIFVLLLAYVVASLTSQESIKNIYELGSYSSGFFGFSPSAAMASLSPLLLLSSAQGVGNIMIFNMLISPTIMLALLAGCFVLAYKIKPTEFSEKKLPKEIDSDHYKKIAISIAILTFILGFVGTLFSRYIIEEEPLQKALIPTTIHIAMGALWYIPKVGWLLFLGAVGYMAYLNIKTSIAHIKSANF